MISTIGCSPIVQNPLTKMASATASDSSDSLGVKLANIDLMNATATGISGGSGSGFDVLIVCTSTEKQAEYWSTRLKAATSVRVYAVCEDWNGGGGRGMPLVLFTLSKRPLPLREKTGWIYGLGSRLGK